MIEKISKFLAFFLLLFNQSCNEQIKKRFLPTQKDFSKNNPGHTILTIQIVDKTSDDSLEQVVFENIINKLDVDSANDDKEYEILKNMSLGRQSIFATRVIEDEVDNGGFNQYFYNSSGQYAEEARVGFELIGASKHSMLTQRAMDIVLKNAKYLKQFKDGTLKSFSKSYENNPFNEVDSLYYELEKTEDVAKLKIKYIREHRDQFIDK